MASSIEYHFSAVSLWYNGVPAPGHFRMSQAWHGYIRESATGIGAICKVMHRVSDSAVRGATVSSALQPGASSVASSQTRSPRRFAPRDRLRAWHVYVRESSMYRMVVDKLRRNAERIRVLKL